MELKETIELMQSGDYKNRFKAEYYQLSIRLDGLKAMLEKWDNDLLEFKPTCSREIYNTQVKAMEDYRAVLANRAEIEGIEL